MQGPPPIDRDPWDDGAIFTEINITPLTDVFLVLLIIFMVVASSEVDVHRQAAETKKGYREKAMQIATPEGPGEGGIVPRDVVISVAPDGTVFVDDTEVPIDDLATKLRDLNRETVAARAVVRGDESLQYGLIIRVIGTARSSGFEEVALATRTPK